MKASLVLVVYAAFVAAAPPGVFDAILKRASPVGTVSASSGECKRCGGSARKKCSRNEVCLGEKEIPGGIGVCVKNPKPCANAWGDSCPTGDFCVVDPNEDCPPDVLDCGGNLCIPKAVGERVGLKHTKPKPTTKPAPRKTKTKTTTTCTTKSKTTTKSTTTKSTTTKTTTKTSPTSNGSLQRCEGPTDKTCPEGETCLAEREIDDGKGGVCIKKPPFCGGGGEGEEVECPNADDVCVEDPNMDCPPNMADCGGGQCLPGFVIKKLGLTLKGKSPWRCGGESGKKCRENIGEICVGENKSSDGMGICVAYPDSCTEAGGTKCSNEKWYTCVTDQNKCVEWKWMNKNFCFKNICVWKRDAEKFGMGEKTED
ncbi:hypothetical protein TWF281_007872 [Arthrobotrys megalospora]